MDYIVETQFEGPGFVAVPNEVAQDVQLSPEALGVLVYLASMPKGWTARVVAIRERFGIGRDRWQRIARELREIGAFASQEVRGPGGKLAGRRVLVGWPKAEVLTESRENRPSVKPTVGKPAKQDRQTRKTGPANPVPYKEERKKTGGRERSEAARRSRAGQLPNDGIGSPLVDVSRLSAFQRTALREGKSVLIRGELVRPGSDRAAVLVEALRSAEKGGV